MDNKIKVLTKDQTIFVVATNMAVRFGKLKKMLDQHEGSLISTTFDMQLIKTKTLDALLKCMEKRDAYLKCRSKQEELPPELQDCHGLCVNVDMETLTDILETYNEMELDCQLNISQHAHGACIGLEYDSYIGYEEK